MASLATLTKVVSSTSNTTKGLAPAFANLLPSAHVAVLAAKNGDPQARAVIADAVAQADDGFGPPAAVATADVLDQAQKMVTRARFVQYWLFGAGADLVLARGGIASPTGALEPGSRFS